MKKPTLVSFPQPPPPAREGEFSNSLFRALFPLLGRAGERGRNGYLSM